MKQSVNTSSPQEKNKTEKERPLQRWRRIALRVGKQKNWTKECIIKVLTDSEGEKSEGTNAPRIPFNANAFKAHVQFGRLSVRAKHLFTKDPDVRTEEDIKDLHRVVEKLQCFSKYSRAVKQGLAKFVYYSQYETTRVVVQQGHPALSFYFILNGSVKVVVEDVDRITGDISKNVVGEILAGESFGELALLHNTHRRATITCKEDTEFLRLDKSDFNQVLRDTYQREWDERMTHLKGISAFQDWPLKELRAANTASKLVDYPDNTLILKGESEQPEFVYLIKTGKCLFVREIELIKRTLPFGREEVYLPPERRKSFNPSCLNRLKKNETLERYFLVIRILSPGDYFGVGENMKDSFMTTKGKVELMLIPRSILSTYNRGKILELMKKELQNREWTREEIFQVFLQNRKWEEYKTEMVRNIVLQKPLLKRTSFKDVPDHVKADNSSHYAYLIQPRSARI